jgi:DNA-binding transcriptional LysR family regulator
MDFRQLEYFVTLARVGHFTRAAAQLHVGQPALSQAIRRLEGELGAELLVRGSHPLALTSAGETLLPYAQQALEALEGARVQFGIRQGEPSGRLVIGALSTLGPVEAVIASFHERHPEVDIVLREAVTLAIFEQLRTSELDAAFATLVEPLPSELDHQEAFTEGLVLMTAPGWWTGGELRLGDLDGQPFVFPPEGNGVRIIVERALRDAGVEPHLAMESNEIQRRPAEPHRGAAVAPRSPSQRNRAGVPAPRPCGAGARVARPPLVAGSPRMIESITSVAGGVGRPAVPSLASGERGT